jgi:hypothetical protein
MRIFRKWCASSKEVRTFQGTALDPVPMTRKVAQGRASALVAFFADKLGAVPLRVDFIQAFLIGRCAVGADFEPHGPQETKRAAPRLQARLRVCEIYSLSLYRNLFFCSCIMRTKRPVGQDGNFLPTREEREAGLSVAARITSCLVARTGLLVLSSVPKSDVQKGGNDSAAHEQN